MKKKLVGLMLVMTMVFTSLTGCSFGVTAESLIDNALKDVENMECEMNMSIQMEVSVSGMSVEMGMKVSADMETSKEVAHTTTTVSMDMLGMEMEEEVENYAVVDGDTVITYTYDSNYDKWYYEESDYDEDDEQELSSDMFKDIEMEKTDDGYVVTGLVEDVEEVLGDASDATTEALIDGLKDVDVIATFNFNKDKEIEALSIVFDVDEDEEYEIEDLGSVSISEMEISIEYKSLDADEVELPKDVKNNAVEASELTSDSYGDYEDVYAVDEDTEELAPIGGIEGTNPPTVDNVSFVINGTELKLGEFTLEDVKSLGYAVDDFNDTEGEEYYINAGDYQDISLYDDNICSCYIYFKNNTDGALDILECDIAGFDFDQSYEMQYEGGVHCDFSILGINAGTSYGDAEAILGTPDDYTAYGTEMVYYYYFDNNYDAQLVLYFDAEYGLMGFDVNTGLYY